MENKIWYDEEHQLLYLQCKGDFSTEDARYFGNKYIELLEGKPYRQIVVDLREGGNMENRETRTITNEMLNQAKVSQVAFIGANAANRMIAKVLLKLGSLKAESDFFKDFEDAYQWIEKRRKQK